MMPRFKSEEADWTVFDCVPSVTHIARLCDRSCHALEMACRRHIYRVDRVRICERCRRLFYAPRQRSYRCSRKCTNALQRSVLEEEGLPGKNEAANFRKTSTNCLLIFWTILTARKGVLKVHLEKKFGAGA